MENKQNKHKKRTLILAGSILLLLTVMCYWLYSTFFMPNRHSTSSIEDGSGSPQLLRDNTDSTPKDSAQEDSSRSLDSSTSSRQATEDSAPTESPHTPAQPQARTHRSARSSSRHQQAAGSTSSSRPNTPSHNSTPPVQSQPSSPTPQPQPQPGGNSTTEQTLAIEIVGLAEVQRTLIASLTNDTSAVRRFQWFADGTPIHDASSFSYTLTPAEKGKKITVRAILTDHSQNTPSITSQPTTTVAEQNTSSNTTGSIKIEGINRVGHAFTAQVTDPDGVMQDNVTYRWYDFYGIALGSGKTIPLTERHAGMQILVQASYTDEAGHRESVVSRFSGAVISARGGGTGAGIQAPVANAPKITLSGPSTVVGGKTATYTVTLDKPAPTDVSADISIAYHSSSPNDAAIRWDSQRVVVQAGKTTATFYVDTKESNSTTPKTYSVSISNAVSGTVNQSNVQPITTNVSRQSIFMLSHKYPLSATDSNAFSPYWQAIYTAGKDKIPYVLINPSAGTGPTVNPGYVKALKKNTELGFQNIVYIRTQQQTRDIKEVQEEAARYVRFYGADVIHGFYFDEVTARNNAATAYMAELYNHIKTTYPGRLVVANPGSHITDGIAPYADIFMTNEGTADEYINNYKTASSAFENDAANSHRIFHTIYDVKPDDYQKVIDLARQRNAGWVFITSDSIRPDGRPYNDLAQDFPSLVNAITNLPRPNDPNRHTTLNVLRGATIGTANVTTSIIAK